MQQTDRIEDYVSAVCSRIRWKKARIAVADELRDHINDQVNAFVADGTERAAAVEAAVLEMGDPVEAGAQLDRIHRPRTDGPLLLMTAILVAVGLVLRSICTGSVCMTIDHRVMIFPREVLMSCGPAVMALVVFLIVYFTDLSRTGWIFCAVYLCLAGLITIISAATGVINKHITYFPLIDNTVIYYLQYLFLPVPIVVTTLIDRLGLKGYSGLVLSLLLFIAAAFGAFAAANTALCVVICTAGLAVMTVAVVKGYFNVKKGVGLLIAYAPAAATLAISLKAIVTRIESVLVLGADPLNNFGLRYSIAKAGLAKGAYIVAGQDFNAAKLPYYDDTNILNYLIVRFGWIVFILLAALMTLFAIELVRNCSKQRSRYGLMISAAVTATLLAQAVIYIAANLGFMLFAPLTLPLLTHGGLYLILNSAMLGVLLSVYRTDNLPQSSASARDRRSSKTQLS